MRQVCSKQQFYSFPKEDTLPVMWQCWHSTKLLRRFVTAVGNRGEAGLVSAEHIQHELRLLIFLFLAFFFSTLSRKSNTLLICDAWTWPQMCLSEKVMKYPSDISHRHIKNKIFLLNCLAICVAEALYACIKVAIEALECGNRRNRASLTLQEGQCLWMSANNIRNTLPN